MVTYQAPTVWGWYKIRTLDYGPGHGLDVDWTVDSIIDLIFGLEFRLPEVRGHTKLISSKVLCEVITCALPRHIRRGCY